MNFGPGRDGANKRGRGLGINCGSRDRAFTRGGGRWTASHPEHCPEYSELMRNGEPRNWGGSASVVEPWAIYLTCTNLEWLELAFKRRLVLVQKGLTVADL